MKLTSNRSTRCVMWMVLAMAWLLAGCSAEGSLPESSLLEGADESTVSASEISASYPVGTTVEATANLNLRTGASTSYRVQVVIPNGSRATTVDVTTPQNGFYKVRYGSTVGFAYGAYLRVVSAGTGSGGSTGTGTGTGTSTGGGTSVDEVFRRAASGVGFAYWWGHGRWLDSGPTSSTQSTCNGSCPSCSHSGSYGADCSGFVAKAWTVPSSNSSLSDDEHPYSTADFRNGTGGGQWSRIDRGSVRRGDALVYNDGGSGHVFLYESADPWGSMWAYEAPGCASGGGRIRHGLRTASSAFVAIRRAGL